MATHDLAFDISQNGMSQPPSYDPQPYAMNNGTYAMNNGTYDMNGNMNGGVAAPNATVNASYMSRLNSESAHPMACVFHCVFKAAAMFLYIFGGWFSGNGKGGTSGANFITVAVLCILLLAADFWVVKNITGRLLVGLRWWNKVEGDSTRWIFECADTLPNGSATIQRNKFDANIFWTVLYATPLIWGALLIIGLLKFQIGWLIIVFMALGLNCSNVYGYYRCSKDQAAKFQKMMQQGVTAQTGALTGALSMMRSSVLGVITGTSTQQSSANTFV